jgi:hypothetical protein
VAERLDEIKFQEKYFCDVINLATLRLVTVTKIKISPATPNHLSSFYVGVASRLNLSLEKCGFGRV